MSSLLKGKAWSDFKRWCQPRRLNPLPAHPWTLAAYARWCEPKLEFSEIEQNLKSIARQHLLAGMAVPNRHPTVKNTLRLIEVRKANRHNNSALFDADDFLKSVPPQAMVPDEPDPGAEENRPKRRKKSYLSMRATPKLVRRRPRED